MQRLRFLDETVLTPLNSGQSYEEWTKLNHGCSGSPSWTPYFQSSGRYRYGRYKHMIDTFDNAPRRKLGTQGYRFNAMTSAEVNVPLGSGTTWQATNIAVDCSGIDTYKRAFRRVERGATLGLINSGLQINNIGGITPNVLDLTKYNLPYDTIERMRGLVATSVMSKRGRGSESNLWETVAEVNKTLGMLAGYVSVARKIYKTAFSRRAARGLSNETAGAYLMTRYGFKPLVSDIFGTLLALEKTLGRVLEFTRAQETDAIHDVSNSVFVDADTFKFSASMTSDTSIIVRGVSVDEYTLDLLTALGLGTKNLVTLPWELVKFSFVLDWFANIGDFLGALAPNLSLLHIGGCTSVKVEKTYVYTASNAGLADSKLTTLTVTQPPSLCQQTLALKYYYRDSDLPGPSLRLKSDFKFDNFLRAADAVSLTVQALSSFRPSK